MDLSDALGDLPSQNHPQTGPPTQQTWPGQPGAPPAWPGQQPNPAQPMWPGQPGAPPGQPTWPGQPGAPPGQPTWPGQPAAWPGQPGAPPGQPTWPGQPGAPPGQPTWPGQPGAPPGQPTWPGQPGAPPGQPTWPGQPGAPPGQPTWPGQPDAPSGQPTWPGQPGGPNQPSAPGWPSPGSGPAPPKAPQNQTPLTIPYSLTLPRGCYDRMVITIHGTINANAKMFTVNLSKGKDIALHINPRFNEMGRKTMVCNSEIGNQWGKEEREHNRFPFVHGQPFEMKIMCTNNEFKIAGNNVHILDFKHRIRDLASINRLDIHNDITLSSVDVNTI